ncbi:aminotransferase class V-fold PLP-dependent enzyme [Tateyamaria omphalii]|uniref:aminotransferase class V-fold PLP-dependent enzyme n=1 Tax=Tateyamaria omphalii TaxID=299262 RepID=UPI0016723784|nr:aminotransferase class V-fold PLP-dependent enzyme [Tateyamaria omphalii]
MVYLATCSLAPRSSNVDAAVAEMLGAMSRPALAWARFEQEIDDLREEISKLINAKPEQIAFLPNASVCAYQILEAMTDLHPLEIVYSHDEFPSIANVWTAEQARGARSYSMDDEGLQVSLGRRSVDPDQTHATLVSVPAVSYLTGRRPNLSKIATTAREAGAVLAIDAYQALGSVPIDVNALNCDFLFAGTMKYALGLPGLAFLYVKEPMRWSAPALTGWFGRQNPFDFESTKLDYALDARRFQTGTIAVPSVFSAKAGLMLLSEVTQKDRAAHIANIVDYTAQKLLVQGEQLVGYQSAGSHGAHVAFLDAEAETLGQRLAEQGIITSPRGNAVRVSCHQYTTTSDIDALCTFLRGYRTHHGGQNDNSIAKSA